MNRRYALVRADVDHFLVNEAIREGCEYLDQVELESPTFEGDIVKLSGSRSGNHFDYEKISGRRQRSAGFLHRTLKLPAEEFSTMLATQGLYSHFENVARFAELNRHDESPPYPIDDAAVHHISPALDLAAALNNGITSAGVAATDEFAKNLISRIAPKPGNDCSI